MQVSFDTLILGLIFLPAGILTLLVAKSGNYRNPLAGYRTTWSMKSAETWVAANRYSGKAMLILAFLLLLTGVLVWWEPLTAYDWPIVMTIMTVGIIVVLVLTERHLRANFNQDGSPKSPGRESSQVSGLTSIQKKKAGSQVRLEFTGLDYIAELLTLLGLIVSGMALLYFWTRLPQEIPQHFNALGQVDAWGSKGSILILPVFALLTYILLSLPRWFSSSLSPNMSVRKQRLTIDCLNILKVELVWIFTYLIWMTIQIALGQASGLHPAFLWLVLFLTLLIPGIYVVLIIRSE